MDLVAAFGAQHRVVRRVMLSLNMMLSLVLLLLASQKELHDSNGEEHESDVKEELERVADPVRDNRYGCAEGKPDKRGNARHQPTKVSPSNCDASSSMTPHATKNTTGIRKYQNSAELLPLMSA